MLKQCTDDDALMRTVLSQIGQPLDRHLGAPLLLHTVLQQLQHFLQPGSVDERELFGEIFLHEMVTLRPVRVRHF